MRRREDVRVDRLTRQGPRTKIWDKRGLRTEQRQMWGQKPSTQLADSNNMEVAGGKLLTMLEHGNVTRNEPRLTGIAWNYKLGNFLVSSTMRRK